MIYHDAPIINVNDKTDNKVAVADIKELRQKGVIREINRRLLHPLGLSLEVRVYKDEQQTETLGRIRDYRDDPEGACFNLENSPDTRIEEFQEGKNFVDRELAKRYHRRVEVLGSMIEEIPSSPTNSEQLFLEDIVDWENNKEYNYFVQDGDGQTKYFFNEPGMFLDQDEYLWIRNDEKPKMGKKYFKRVTDWRTYLVNPYKELTRTE